MDQPPYTIAFNRDAARLEATLWGFWSAAQQEQFAAEFTAAMDRARGSDVRFTVLFDASAFTVQSADVAQGFARLVDADDVIDRIPVAAVIGSALLKLQAARMLTAGHLRLFDDRRSAIAWLDSLAPSYRVPAA